MYEVVRLSFNWTPDPSRTVVSSLHFICLFPMKTHPTNVLQPSFTPRIITSFDRYSGSHMYPLITSKSQPCHLHLWIFVSIPFGILRNTSEIPIILRRKNYPQPHVHWNFGMLTPFISPHFK